MARVIDRAAVIVEGIFYHTVVKVELRGSTYVQSVGGPQQSAGGVS
jgi:hypothetical protein